MRINNHHSILAKLLATSALAMIITGAPATVDFDSGAIAIKPSIALADSGNSGSGSDSSGSGSGGDSDSSGSGSGGSSDSDSSGSGSGGGDDDGDNSGENQADDDESGETEVTLADGTRIEVSGDNIEVEFANGWKEEIVDGQFEMKDPKGNTVIERPATEEDHNRLEGFIPN